MKRPWTELKLNTKNCGIIGGGDGWLLKINLFYGLHNPSNYYLLYSTPVTPLLGQEEKIISPYGLT